MNWLIINHYSCPIRVQILLRFSHVPSLYIKSNKTIPLHQQDSVWIKTVWEQRKNAFSWTVFIQELLQRASKENDSDGLTKSGTVSYLLVWTLSILHQKRVIKEQLSYCIAVRNYRTHVKKMGSLLYTYGRFWSNKFLHSCLFKKQWRKKNDDISSIHPNFYIIMRISLNVFT